MWGRHRVVADPDHDHGDVVLDGRVVAVKVGCVDHRAEDLVGGEGGRRSCDATADVAEQLEDAAEAEGAGGRVTALGDAGPVLG